MTMKDFRLFDFKVADKSELGENDYSDDSSQSVISDSNNNKVFIIQLFGINEQGESVCIKISDYKPFFYIKVDDSFEKSDMAILISELKSKVTSISDDIIKYKFVEKKNLYGFDNYKNHKFIKITFNNKNAMDKVRYLFKTRRGLFVFKSKRLSSDKQNCYLYEGNIPPLLRFFHIHDISPSGWIQIADYVEEEEDGVSTCTYEYNISKADIKPLNDKETKVPYKICSFDIEASSSHGDFPMAKKNYTRLADQIIDYWNDNDISDMVRSKQVEIMLYILYTAFDIVDEESKLNSIDKIFIKSSIEKEDIIKKVDALNNFTIEQIKENKQIQRPDFNIVDFHDGEEALLKSIEDEDVETTNKFYSSNNVVVADNETLFNILNSNLSKDDKSSKINETLSRIFPKVEGDKVTFIGSTFMKYGQKEPYLNHCIALNDCDKSKDVKNYEIKECETEEKVLLAWTELIQREDPDIVIGYNIFGFDYQFMFQRAEENRCVSEFLQLSRISNEVCGKEQKGKIKKIEESKIIIASGEHDLKYIKMTGRIQIDLYNYFRRDYNLSSYKLDNVASHFISDDVVKSETYVTRSHKHGTKIFTKNMMGLEVGSFVHFEESSHSVDYYKDGAKFKITKINKENKSFCINSKEIFNPLKKIRWGLAKDDVTPQDIFRYTEEGSEGRGIVAKYCIQDCNLVHHLLNKIDVITGFIEMAKICSVPMDFLVMRGQGIKLTSFISKKCREKDTLMPVLNKGGSNDGYEGAIVLDPKSDLYLDNPVACVDYASLYPSSMISENLSHDTKVWSKEYNLKGSIVIDKYTGEQKINGERNDSGEFIYDNLPEYDYVDITYDTYEYIKDPNASAASAAVKTKVGYKICRWAQRKDGKKGIMPSILEELLGARKSTRKLIPQESDEFMKNVLDKRQLSYKLTANSLYGQCGAKTSTFYEKDVAASTTAKGRNLLIYAKRTIEEEYGNHICETKALGTVRTRARYVYGDTDSVFFTFNFENVETGEKIVGKPALEATIELAQEVGKRASKSLKKPHDLEYEKTFMPFCLLSKKRYVGMLYETDPNKCQQKSMGIVLKRRDNANIVKDIYGGIIEILMKEKNIDKAVGFLKDCLQNLIDEKYPIEKLIISKSLRSKYKDPKRIAHKVLADRIAARDPGNKPASGDRIPYVYIVNKSGSKLQGDKIEIPSYINENKLIIDYAFYITNQVMKPVQQLFALVLEKLPGVADDEDELLRIKEDLQLIHNEVEDSEKREKKKEAYRAKEVKRLLFDYYIDQIPNEEKEEKERKKQERIKQREDKLIEAERVRAEKLEQRKILARQKEVEKQEKTQLREKEKREKEIEKLRIKREKDIEKEKIKLEKDRQKQILKEEKEKLKQEKVKENREKKLSKIKLVKKVKEEEIIKE